MAQIDSSIGVLSFVRISNKYGSVFAIFMTSFCHALVSSHVVGSGKKTRLLDISCGENSREERLTRGRRKGSDDGVDLQRPGSRI